MKSRACIQRLLLLCSLLMSWNVHVHVNSYNHLHLLMKFYGTAIIYRQVISITPQLSKTAIFIIIILSGEKETSNNNRQTFLFPDVLLTGVTLSTSLFFFNKEKIK